jgi:hypothetical protein
VRPRRLNSPVQKGEALPACPFGKPILQCATSAGAPFN